jgi:thymidylate synthase (FAD)
VATVSRIDVLDKGFVALVDVMGNDRTPAKVARTSFNNNNQLRTEEQDAKLVRYLVEHKHTTPLEFCQVRFYFKAPIFVARQIMRHRTASINEVSYRYVEAKEEFYVPRSWRMVKKATDNKQGSSDEQVQFPEAAAYLVLKAGREAVAAYCELLDHGVAPEIARTVLPLGLYTEWEWCCDLHNTIHFLKLRLDKHAQWETRQYAEAMLQLLLPVFPNIIEASGLTNGD